MLTACGIETILQYHDSHGISTVATVLTACGIETILTRLLVLTMILPSCNSAYRLRYWNLINTQPWLLWIKLQQCLPLAVLKRYNLGRVWKSVISCNSAYRLRYWNNLDSIVNTGCLPVATVLTACGIETIYDTARLRRFLLVATVLTACGIETILKKLISIRIWLLSCNSAYRLRYWNFGRFFWIW